MFFIMSNPINKAVEFCGGVSALANRINEKANTISMWIQRGNIPSEKVLSVSKATEYQITPHQLRSDLYPYQFDGLPQHMRADA